jgi:hypothetical protein
MINMKKSILAVLFISGLTLSVFAAATNSMELLPADNALAGWVKTENVACYSCTVFTSNPDSLYAKIDGGATVYINFGFTDGAYEGYGSGGSSVCVEVFNQASLQNALGLWCHYDSLSIGDRVIAGLGDTARIDTEGLFTNTIEFVTGAFFIRMNIQSKNQADYNAAVALGQIIVNNASAVEKGWARGPRVEVVLNNFPDPARGGCHISLSGAALSKAAVPCSIMDCRGRLVRSLELGRVSLGTYQAFWNGAGEKSGRVSAGRYLAVVNLDGRKLTKAFVMGK